MYGNLKVCVVRACSVLATPPKYTASEMNSNSCFPTTHNYNLFFMNLCTLEVELDGSELRKDVTKPAYNLIAFGSSSKLRPIMMYNDCKEKACTVGCS